jgi:glycine amidinotransferase/scyllo-inosamine-4-phosphate amidinotransferase 1
MINDVVAQGFYEYPYASKWIALNMLSIDPQTVIVDGAQESMINVLEALNFVVIPLTLRHSRTLGGGFHCVTLDLVRD